MLDRIGEFVGRIADRRSTIILSTAFAIVVFGLFDYFADVAMKDSGFSEEVHAAALATFVGAGAGVATFVLLLARRERRRIVQDELRRLAELNHRLRNSLQLIADAHYSTGDATHRKMMMEAVATMDESLKQLFPALGVEQRKRVRQEKSLS
jgi:hypothetical protein